MKWNYLLFALAIGLPILVAALDTTVQVVKTVEVTSVSTAVAPAAATSVLSGADTGSADGDGSSFEDPNTAGASGEDTGAFSISKGGLIAIITVVTAVAVFGIGSLVLWYIAKKRSWEIRASLRRASRRLTGRLDESRSRRQSRRTGIRMDSPPAPKNRQLRDLEKGRPAEEKRKQSSSSNGTGKTTTTITSHFEVETPIVKSWRSKFSLSGNKSSR